MVNKSNIGELTVEQKDFKVTIKQKEEHVTQVVSAAPMQAAPVQAFAPPIISTAVSAPPTDNAKAAETAVATARLVVGGLIRLLRLEELLSQRPMAGATEGSIGPHVGASGAD